MNKSPRPIGHLSHLPRNLALAILIASATAAHAKIVAYEGFKYTTGQLTTKTGTGSGFTGDWDGISGLSGNNLTSFNVTEGSLEMTDVYSSGNKLFFQREPNQTAGLTRAFTTPLATDQTLYGSYLFQFNSTGLDGRTVGGILTGSASDTDNAATFAWMGDGYNNSGGITDNIEGPNVRAEGTQTPVPTFSLSINTTYVMIFEFDAATTTTSAWVLNEAQLTNVGVSVDTLTAALLNLRTGNTNDATGVAWKGTVTDADPAGAMTNLSLLGLSGGQALNYSFTYDEIRISEKSLFQAVAVPEPSTIAVAMGLGAFAFHRAVRRRRGA